MKRRRHRLAAAVARSGFVDPVAGATPDHLARWISSPGERAALRDRYLAGLAEAARHGRRHVLIAPSRGLNREVGRRLGLDAIELADLNRRAVALIADLRDELAAATPHLLLAGAVGPLAPEDPAEPRLPVEAARYRHAGQIAALASTGADLLLGDGFDHADEALGVALAAEGARLPVVIGLAPDHRGRLRDGEPLPRVLSRLHAMGRARPLLYRLERAADEAPPELPERAAWSELVRVTPPPPAGALARAA